MPNTHNRDTIDIENAGGSVLVRAYGRTIVEVAIRGDGAASYRVDGREDKDQAWVEGIKADPNYTGSANYDDTIQTGWSQLRIVCTSGTATAGDTAEIVLCAGGD